MTVSIRRGTPADAPALAEFAARVFGDTFAADNSAEDMEMYLSKTFGREQQESELGDASIITLLAGSGESLAGYAQLRTGPVPDCITGDSPIELWRFYVSKEWHGRGVAGTLMEAVEAESHLAGARTLWLAVWEHNERAKAFYRKYGFADVGEKVFVLGTDAQIDRIYARPLGHADPAESRIGDLSQPAAPDHGLSGRVPASLAWESAAHRFIASRSRIGADTVRAWCRSLPAGASVLDLGCGFGVPVAEAAIGEGCDIHGVDSSPTLVAAFRERFPGVAVACAPVETSDFFGRKYDGALAVGLIFLLDPDRQRSLIRRVAAALEPGGRFLFTAPTEEGSWPDSLTGSRSISLGDREYRRLLSEAGLVVVDEHVDEGGNHYYDTRLISDGTGSVRAIA